MSTALNVPSDLAYLVLRTALNRFEKPTADLSSQELAAVAVYAKKQFLVETQILNSPEAASVVVTPEQFEKSWNEVVARYADQQAFEEDLIKNGMDVSSFEQAIRRELHVEAILELVSSRAADISDVDVKIYYYMHPEKFEMPPTRTARHILITINPDYSENTRENALKRLQLIAKRLDKKPERFAEQAAKHSECPTAMNGGTLGRVKQQQLFPSLDAVLFNMKEAEISDVVESELGFHLLLCEKVHEAGPLSLEEAYDSILTLLKKRRQRMCQKGWLVQLQNTNKD